MISILNLEPEEYSKKAKSIIEEIGDVSKGPLSRNQLIDQISKYDAVIIRLSHLFDEEIFQYADKLKVIITATTGLNHIDLDAAKRRGIAILSLKNENSFLDSVNATSEHTWALIMSTIRNIPQAYKSVKQGNWNRNIFKGNELFNSTIGIVGFGRIGKKVAKYAQAFGMKILAFDEKKSKKFPNVYFTKSIYELIENSDVITVHVPLNSKNKNMFSKKEFDFFRKGSVFINTSRGELINESDLIEALKNGNILTAGLDVVCNELQIKDGYKSEIIDFMKNNNRLIITPHIGGATYESMENTEIFMAERLRDYFKTKLK